MSKEYFKTSDGNVFYTRNAAENHAKSLVDKTIATTETVESIKPIGPVGSTEAVKSTMPIEEKGLVEANKPVASEEPIKKETKPKK